MNTPTRWLTNSGCIAPTLSTKNYQEPKGKITGKLVAPGKPENPGISEDSELTCTLRAKRSNDHEINPAIQVGPVYRCGDGPACNIACLCRSWIDEEHQQEEWEAEDDVKGGPFDPHEVKAARQKEIQYLCDWEVPVLHRSGIEDTSGTQPSWASNEAPRCRSRLVCTVRHEGFEPIFSATRALGTLRVRLGVACQEDVFSR